jgi:hypothetical protein
MATFIDSAAPTTLRWRSGGQPAWRAASRASTAACSVGQRVEREAAVLLPHGQEQRDVGIAVDQASSSSTRAVQSSIDAPPLAVPRSTASRSHSARSQRSNSDATRRTPPLGPAPRRPGRRWLRRSRPACGRPRRRARSAGHLANRCRSLALVEQQPLLRVEHAEGQGNTDLDEVGHLADGHPFFQRAHTQCRTSRAVHSPAIALSGPYAGYQRPAVPGAAVTGSPHRSTSTGVPLCTRRAASPRT